MPSNNFDDPILIDNGVGTPAAPGAYLGMGRATDASVSTGARLYAGTGNPNGVLTAPSGSLYASSDGGAGSVGTLFVNTDGGTTWALASAVV